MDSIYEWLLLSTGNEGNYYTILNCQRTTSAEGQKQITIMARQPDFKVLNILIYSGPATDAFEKTWQTDHAVLQRMSVGTEKEVLDFLKTGNQPNPSVSDPDKVLHLLIGTPTGESGSITFH